VQPFQTGAQVQQCLLVDQPQVVARVPGLLREHRVTGLDQRWDQVVAGEVHSGVHQYDDRGVARFAARRCVQRALGRVAVGRHAGARDDAGARGQ
jgi:hypothetical protein